jgi:soluble cytochrome b562
MSGWSPSPELMNECRKKMFYELLDEYLMAFEKHVSAVDSATKLTQHQPDSQLKRAKKGLALLKEFRNGYRY